MTFKTILNRITPPPAFIVWWVAALLIFLWFDILWCADSDFRPFLRYRSLYFMLPCAATVFTLPSVLSRKAAWQFWTLAALALLLEANLIYFRTYYTSIPISSYGLVTNLKGFEGSVLEGMRLPDVGFALILAGALVCRRVMGRPTSLFNPWAYAAVLALLVCVNYAFFLSRGGFRQRMDELSGSVSDMTVLPPVYTVFLTMLHEAITNDTPPTEQEIENARQWLEQRGALAAAYVPADSAASPRNLVLIMCESLESWPINLEIEGQTVTPFLNSLVADTANVYYNPAVLTQARAGRSIDGQLLYTTGRYPMSKGVFAKDHAMDDYYSLPKAMKEIGGGITYLISSDLPTTWNQGRFAASIGVDSLLLYSRWSRPEDSDWAGGSDILDHRLLERSHQAMESGQLWPVGQRAFMLVVTHSGHNPFVIPDGLSPLSLDGDYPDWLRNYITTTAYVDAALEDFITYLRSRPDAAHTVIAIVGDHEGLGTHRREVAADGRYAFVSQENHTPLILINSPYAGLGEFEITQADVYSALLDAAGLYKAYPWRGMGRSPFDTTYTGTSPSEAARAQTVGNLLFTQPALLGQ